MTVRDSTQRHHMTKWLWLALIPAIAFAGARPYNMRKDPVYIDVHPDRIIVMPEKIEIAESELTVPQNNFECLLEQVASVRNSRYVLLILRPGSEILQHQLRQTIRKYDVDIGVDVWEEGREFSPIELMGIYEMGTADPPKPDPLEHIRIYPVTVEKDRIIFDNDKIVVTREELQIPGNPFETLVDRFEANGGNPYIFPYPINSPLVDDLWNVMRKRAPQMVSNYLAKNATVITPTPIEANTEEKRPVVFECRHNQLFFIRLEQPQATDPETQGYSFDSPREETDEKWFGSQLTELDPDTQYIWFKVRPDSFDIFRKARKVVWDYKLESTCELLGPNDPIQIESKIITDPQFNHTNEIPTKP